MAGGVKGGANGRRAAERMEPGSRPGGRWPRHGCRDRAPRLLRHHGGALPAEPTAKSRGLLHEERTYPNLVGPLGAEPTVWAECVFVDPVADLAVLGTPDGQELFAQAADYEALTEAARPLSIGSLTYVRKRVALSKVRRPILGPPRAESDAWLLSLGGQWFSCRVRSAGRTLWIEEPEQPIQPGMSGSPIVAPDGAAIGVVSIGAGPNPELAADLPAWILRITGAAVRPFRDRGTVRQ